MEDKVVAHFKDGKTLRGLTQDFHPGTESFHLLPSEGSAGNACSTTRMISRYITNAVACGAK